jgi:hypothetical protein
MSKQQAIHAAPSSSISLLTSEGRVIVQSVSDKLASLLAKNPAFVAGDVSSEEQGRVAGVMTALCHMLADRDFENALLRFELLVERRVLSRRLVLEETLRFLHCDLARMASATAVASQAKLLVPSAGASGSMAPPPLPAGFSPVFELHQTNRYVMKHIGNIAETHSRWLSPVGQALAAEISQQGIDVHLLQKLGAKLHSKASSPMSILETAQAEDAKPPLLDGEMALLAKSLRLFQLVN